MNQNRQMEYFANNYDFIAKFISAEAASKVYLGERTKRSCRYCSKGEPEVAFHKKAHAIPEFTGNKRLFSYDECDSCNEFFSQTVEDDFAKYLGAMRTLAQIRGKKGVPSYKGKDGRSRVDMEAAGLKITSYQDAPMFDLDLEKNILTITAHRQPYTPMGVFKCFVKMAIAICPAEYLTRLEHLIAWIRNPEHTHESFPYKPLLALQQFTPGPYPYGGVSIFLLRRRAGSSVPFMQFVIAFGNTVFQVVLPMPGEDRHLLGRPMKLVAFPTRAVPSKFGKTRLRQVDLSGTGIVRDEPLELRMRFEQATEISVSRS